MWNKLSHKNCTCPVLSFLLALIALFELTCNNVLSKELRRILNEIISPLGAYIWRMISFESSVRYVWGGLDSVRIWMVKTAYEASNWEVKNNVLLVCAYFVWIGIKLICFIRIIQQCTQNTIWIVWKKGEILSSKMRFPELFLQGTRILCIVSCAG